MSQIETVIRASKQLEQLLEQHYGATGRGLHEKTSSIEDQLDHETIRGLRKIATLRNKVVHEDFEIDDLVDFQCDAQQLVQQLTPTPKTKPSKAKAKAKTTSTSHIDNPFMVADEQPIPKKPKRATAQPSKTRSITPRPQPKVQPAPRQQTKTSPQRNTTKNPKTKPAAPVTSSRLGQYLPAFSSIMILLMIVWVLAH
ncbi:MAG: hypothetical protein VXW65_12640 [Pseudomonadota bacterium]|nr:hypothetical protein [Pseudomonadota bacterium]